MRYKSPVSDRNRKIKKTLSNIFARENVKVTGGRGTAYGWIHLNINLPVPFDCVGHDKDGQPYAHTHNCPACLETVKTAERVIDRALDDSGVYNYTDDMGYKHRELLTNFTWK
jgi:hypothetical protein